ncbi:GNAT family N-acetyltransferase [Pseudomonas eucalypticola]|uniref:GNAT family N-acetyltransferase n=1 Tax=Pseudomonas eucalypticola TaxID=2599595 RepID=A0A7D5HE92_9PSED|nr:GNAT family N-acetyltransferase [Pseudomonas eucalypticola]QKZ05310.1 GNAT family N-acetyltransferase [Pseudomonas eucalypticola]
MSLNIRPATIADAELILGFITELAIYEKAEHEVIASIDDIRHSLQDPLGYARALVAELDGEAVGFALYFLSYSTWLGRKGMYLEDLYVSSKHRGVGAGKALLKRLAQIAHDSGCGRLEWSVLDWNEPAIQFYESIGAAAQPEWIRYRLAGDSLKTFAQAD